MRVGLARFEHLNPSDLQTYQKCGAFMTAIGMEGENAYARRDLWPRESSRFSTRRQWYESWLDLPFVQVPISCLSTGTHLSPSRGRYTFLDARFLTEFDVLECVDLFRWESAFCVERHRNVFVLCWENIPFNNYVRSTVDQVLRKARHFITCTEMGAACLLLYGVDKDRVSVVPRAVDLDKFRPAPDRHRGRPVVLATSRFQWGKGLLDVIWAAGLLSRDTKDFEVRLLGGGRAQERRVLFQAIERLGLRDLVKMLEPVEHDRMPRVYQDADVFCLPSIPTPNWHEQWGYSLTEAMASGLACIATTSDGACAQLPQECLIPPQNYIRLYEMLRMFIRDRKAIDDCSREMRKIAEQRFDNAQRSNELRVLYSTYSR